MMVHLSRYTNFKYLRVKIGGVGWFTPVIPVTPEAETGGSLSNEADLGSMRCYLKNKRTVACGNEAPSPVLSSPHTKRGKRE